jgi:Peptidase family M28
MAAGGWKQLIPPTNYPRGEGAYPIEAYSEFMPPPRFGWKAYRDATPDPNPFDSSDPWGWRIPEYDEAREVRPGLLQVARQVLHHLARLMDGDPHTDIPRLDLVGNPYWAPELDTCKSLKHERCVTLMPLALSKTQDDKGRVRWTLFGGSEQGPAKPFWRGFFTAPGREAPPEEGLRFVHGMLQAVYGEKADTVDAIRKVGFRVMDAGEPVVDYWDEGKLPKWVEPFRLKDGRPTTGVKYLLTFRPFARLPAGVRKAYLAGKLHLIPFPGSLVFWGAPSYLRLREELPLAMQIPILHTITRHHAPGGLRAPQEGFFHRASAEHPEPSRHAGPLRTTFRRTHRWDRVARDQDELAHLTPKDEPILHVLFSTYPDDVSLYDKPQARNVQLWAPEGRLLLDGPHSDLTNIRKALQTVEVGGMFGYRFLYPAMRVGKHEVYWHRPLAAYHVRGTGEVALLPDAPFGYLTAYPADRPRPEKPVELWPRLLRRPLQTAVLDLYESARDPHALAMARSLRKLADGAEVFGRPLPRSLARSLITAGRTTTLEAWLDTLPKTVPPAEVQRLIDPVPAPLPLARGGQVPASLTFERTARREFEVAYWKTIAELAEGVFLNKNNADCVRDETTQQLLPYHERHLEPLGDYLLAFYQKQITAARMTGKALAGEVPFRWETDYDYPWMGGWLKNREIPAERDLLVVIPGKDRKRAIVMGDHYDTAYMEDRYGNQPGGGKPRIAACGADDNHSATVALMLAAPVLLDLSRRGLLGCDVWLVHLTGEEFPADCLGARVLTERLVEQTLELHLPGGKRKDLSGVRVDGVYVSDMIAHNNDHDRDVFQITPGTGRESLWLAYQAHIANEIWNASVPEWNRRSGREGLLRCRRSPHGAAVPAEFPHIPLCGQVRPVTDPRSTLFNTDGQIFSDAGVPVVLFMENYDINRTGYHDMHDTMANIDLDYGAAFAAIAIESVARAATEKKDL